VFDSWNGDLYRHGLLYKRVSVKTLIINDTVMPAVEELDRWIAAEVRIRALAKEMPDVVDASEVADGLFLDTAAMAGRRKVSLFKGDSVKVIRGEQSGLSGTIVGFDGNIVLIRSPEWGAEPLRAARLDVVKSFNIGDHVKVTSGKRVGNSGVIVAIGENEQLTLFTDATREEIRVTSANIADSSDLAADDRSAVASFGKQFKLFELVHPVNDRDAKAVIVGVQGDTVSALDSLNTVHEYPASDLRHVPRDAFTHALDARGNKLSRNIALHVTSGPLKDRTGVIVEVTGSTVFFKGSDEVRNCGILAVSSHDCEAQAAAARTITSIGGRGANGNASRMDPSGVFKMPAPVPMGALSSLAGGRGGASAGGRMAGAPRVYDDLKDADVKIVKGPYKGHLGKVVDTNEKTVRVELRAKMKVVTVKREIVKNMDDDSSRRPSGIGGFGSGGGAGVVGSGARGGFGSFGSGVTPARGALPGARTPYEGSTRTPYGGRTPSHSGAFGNRTPAHSGSFGIGFGSRTPLHQTQHGNRTPAHPGAAFGAGAPRAGAPRTPAHHGSGTDAFAMATPVNHADDYGSGANANAFDQSVPGRAGMVGGAGSGTGNANPYSVYGSTVPQTPGTPGALPVTPGGAGYPMTPVDPSLMPQTPVDPGYNMPQTPQMNGYEPQTPTPYGDVNTPGPIMVPQTPQTPEPSTPLPDTPGPMMDDPGTPAGPMEGDDQEGISGMGYRVLIDVVVSVPDMGGRSAVVLDAAVDGSFVSVRMLDDDLTHQLNGSQFTPVQPRIEEGVENYVKVLDGPLAGRIGKLLSMEQQGTGVVDFGQGDVHVMDMSFVAKYQQAHN
jgi:transcription elongation factor SPT5